VLDGDQPKYRKIPVLAIARKENQSMNILCIENERSWRLRQHAHIMKVIREFRPYWNSDIIAFHLDCAAAMRRKIV